MFADPITVTVNAVAKSLSRINSDNYSSEYLLREATQEFRLKIRNSQGKPTSQKSITGVLLAQQPTDRHSFELTQTVYATATAPQFVRKSYIVVEHLHVDTVVDPVNLANALVAFATSANITKTVNFEN